MDSENHLIVYCPEDNEYKVYCDVCDNFCIERFYKNHLKSNTHINNIHKIEKLNKSFEAISLN